MAYGRYANMTQTGSSSGGGDGGSGTLPCPARPPTHRLTVSSPYLFHQTIRRGALDPPTHTNKGPQQPHTAEPRIGYGGIVFWRHGRDVRKRHAAGKATRPQEPQHAPGAAHSHKERQPAHEGAAQTRRAHTHEEWCTSGATEARPE